MYVAARQREEELLLRYSIGQNKLGVPYTNHIMLRHGLVAIQVLSCISITHAHRQLGYNPLDNIEKYQLLMGESLHDSPTSDPVLFKNEKDYGSIHFHNVTFLSAHNAHANHFAAGSNFV